MSRTLPPPVPSDLAPRGLAALALSLLLAGCAVGPDFQSPAAPAVDAYVAPGAAPAADAGQQLAAGADIPAQGWRLFPSEALDALVRQALATSPTLDEARARLRQAAEDLNAETGGRLLPSVDGNLSVARQKVDPSAFGVPVAEQPAPFTLYNASIDVSYTLDVFGANRRALEGLGAQVDYQRHELQAARMSLAANVVTAAIRQADLSERRDVTRELLAAQVRQRGHHAPAPDAGGVSQADLSNQELLVAQTRATLPAAGLPTGAGHAPAGHLSRAAARGLAPASAAAGGPGPAAGRAHRRAVGAHAPAARRAGRRGAVAPGLGRRGRGHRQSLSAVHADRQLRLATHPRRRPVQRRERLEPRPGARAAAVPRRRTARPAALRASRVRRGGGGLPPDRAGRLPPGGRRLARPADRRQARPISRRTTPGAAPTKPSGSRKAGIAPAASAT